jgi:hypothetical protein
MKLNLWSAINSGDCIDLIYLPFVSNYFVLFLIFSGKICDEGVQEHHGQ